MSTQLGFGIERVASNQLSCEVCGGYFSHCWAKKFGECTCADREQRWRLLGAWERVGGANNATWDRRQRRRRPYTSSLMYLFWKMQDSQKRFHSEVNGFVGKGKTFQEALGRVCDEWNSRETARNKEIGLLDLPVIFGKTG